MLNCFRQAAQAHQRVAEVVVADGVVGPEPQRHVIFLDGFIQSSQVAVGVAQAVVRIDMVGANSQGVLIKVDRFGQSAFGGEDDTEVVQCVGIVGFDSQGGLVVFAASALMPSACKSCPRLLCMMEQFGLAASVASQSVMESRYSLVCCQVK